MKHILFVDPVLEYHKLYKSYFTEESGWSIYCVEDVLAAIDHLNCFSVDVLVTELSIPLFNGEQILTYVKKRYPNTIRVIYTSSKNTTLRLDLIPLANQFIEKRDPIGNIYDSIGDLFRVHRDVIVPRAGELLNGMERMPTLPSTYYKVQDEIRRGASLRQIGGIIASDISLGATVLKAVNSAYFGLPKRITSVEQAVSLLGLDSISSLLLSSHLFSLWKGGDASYLDSIQKHSMLSVRFARAIADFQRASTATTSAVSMAALVHEIGRVVMRQLFPDISPQELKPREGESLSQRERALFGVSRMDVAAYLLALWGFSSPIVEVVACCNSPEKYRGDHFGVLMVLHTADVFAYDFGSEALRWGREYLNEDLIKRASITDQVASWRDLCEDVVQSTNC